MLSRVQLFGTPWTVARQASLSSTNSWSPPKPMSIESVMPSSHLILCRLLLLLPPIFPSIRVFSNESALRIRWPKYWSFSFSISPSNESSGLISFRMDWPDLLAVQGTLKSLLQHHSSKASLLRRSAFFTVQLSVVAKVQNGSLGWPRSSPPPPGKHPTGDKQWKRALRGGESKRPLLEPLTRPTDPPSVSRQDPTWQRRQNSSVPPTKKRKALLRLGARLEACSFSCFPVTSCVAPERLELSAPFGLTRNSHPLASTACNIITPQAPSFSKPFSISSDSE